MLFHNPIAVERDVVHRLKAFDLPSLLHLLAALGWNRDEILFVSHVSTTSQPGLLHSIAFHRDPRRQVRIELNMGLLSAQSPLPSYFFKHIDYQVDDVSAFYAFIHFFDHRLLSDLIDYIYPETNGRVFGDANARQSRFLSFLNLRSVATLHWLFRGFFPELGLAVEKVRLGRVIRSGDFRLGTTRLGGDAVFGARTRVAVSGRRVTFFVDEEQNNAGEPWAAFIRRRLTEDVFPLIALAGLDLEIFLVLESERSWTELGGESFLGYDRLRGGDEARRRLQIFGGRVSKGSNAGSS
ncbi:MAG: type VI secretion system baseplate subunit TssG [Deltaproteobacteria bacterium]|nr:type VI secretion system baseplate subunit TssG [Deltaproteobacteria bacterium]